MTFTISLAMICKDNADGLDRVLSQVGKYFDEIVVVDTESEDGGAAVGVAQQHGAKVLTYKRPEGFPWVDSFSAARNMSFDACTGDFIVWLDSDDMTVGFERLRDCIQQACIDTRPGADTLFMRYDYAFDEYGNCTTQLWRERVVRKGIFKWEAPLHEVLLPIGGRPFETAKLVGLGVPYVTHKSYIGASAPESERKRLERNLAILARWEATKDEHLAEWEANKLRMTLYKGNHLLGAGRFDEALVCYEAYIKESGWPEEIYIALINMGRCFKGKAHAEKNEEDSVGFMLKAVTCYRDACFSIPDHHEAHANLADVYLILGELNKAEYHARQAMEVKCARFIPVENPATKDVLPITVLQTLCFQQQRWADAFEWGKKAAILLPDDKGVRDMLMKTQQLMDDKGLYDAFQKVRAALEKEPQKLPALFKAIPERIADLGDLARYMRAPRPAGKRSVAIYCGGSVEEWSPSSLFAGIGGSEEAVIFMAYELRNLGYHVEVYGQPPMAEQGDVQGVQWLPAWAYDPESPPDIFVAWRGHDFLKLGMGATKRILWLHDRQAELMAGEVIEAADAILVLSEDHRADYGLSTAPDSKVHLSANGLHPKWLKEPHNEPGRAAYASCPTRGLKTLLALWPRIRAGVDAKLGEGKAQLHVYYGFSPLYDVHARQNPALRALKAEILEAVKQPGVIWHGKVGQQELAEVWAKSSAWLYPTEFPETSCITAMRAQASGCFPVTSGFAALAETCAKWDRGPVHKTNLITQSPERLDAFVEAAVAALTETREARRQEMASWAKDRFSWAAVAKDWHLSLFSGASQPSRPLVALEPSLASS